MPDIGLSSLQRPHERWVKAADSREVVTSAHDCAYCTRLKIILFSEMFVERLPTVQCLPFSLEEKAIYTGTLIMEHDVHCRDTISVFKTKSSFGPRHLPDGFRRSH